MALEIPKYDPSTDYVFLYHKMFQENERALQQYDALLAQREADLSLYWSMKRGDFAHLQYQQRVMPDLLASVHGKGATSNMSYDQVAPSQLMTGSRKRSQPFAHLLDNSADMVTEREELKNDSCQSNKRQRLNAGNGAIAPAYNSSCDGEE